MKNKEEAGNTMKNKRYILLIVLVIISLAVIPLLMRPNAEFSGADAQAQDAIAEIAPDYKPWAESILKLPSGEVESLLFSLQAGIGGLIVGYALAYFKYGRKKKDPTKEA